jgi:arylsulfatase A-like enzyme
VSYKNKVGDEPTGKDHPEMLKQKLDHGHDATIINGISRIGWMSGGKSARWVDEDMADVITAKAVSFVERNKDKPFFLYFATHDIHVPRVPHKRFVGTSECGIRGDAVHQLDWTVGEMMKTLDRLGIAENTLVIFSADNGPVVNDGYLDGSVKNLNGHTPGGPLRGTKYSLYEGGHRVPFIARWPAKITSGELLSLVDLPATCAALTGQKLSDDAAPDSLNMSAALLGTGPGRSELVVHAGQLGIRKGDWKWIPFPPGEKAGQPGQLFDLKSDLGETKSVTTQHPEVVKELNARLLAIRDAGRSR